MKSGVSKKTGAFFAILLAASALYFVWPWIYFVGSLVEHTMSEGPRPTDAEILEKFKANKSDFLELIEMVQKDKVEIGKYKIGSYRRDRPFMNIGTSWHGADESTILKEYNLTAQRYDKYLSLLAKCGVKQVKPEPSGAVKFYFQHFLTIDYASYTALFYSPGGPPEKLELKANTNKGYNVYAVVQNDRDWYITTSGSP